MKILGVGLSKTGTTTLSKALEILGYRSIHFDEGRLNDLVYGLEANPDFRRYDDVDAVIDLPASYFYRELLEAYPQCKAILTIRDCDSWWNSIEHHSNRVHPVARYGLREALADRARAPYRRLRRMLFGPPPAGTPHLPLTRPEFIRRVRALAYGSTHATEFLYKKRYLEHNRRVQAEIAPERLLVMNIIEGDGWEPLCRFLKRPVPAVDFPAENRSDYRSGRS